MPNQGVPVIFKNKIAYGYAEKSVQAYDVSVSDYNALTEQQQLDGSIRFIQGVDAIPNGSNVWAKLGTTPLAEGLPRDCSQAINELKSNLTDLATIDFGESSSVVSVNGTYQIPAEVLAHTFIIIGARRQGWGNSVMFLTANLLATDNGFFLPTQSNQGYSLKCSSTGLLTLTAKTSGVNEPFIFVQGIF